MRLRWLLLCGFLVGWAMVVSAAQKFYNINALFGISMREVNSVCRDQTGFIWASSKTGILRLTEDDYRIYHLPYENTNVITVKLVYENSKLIAYTNNGQIFMYDYLYDRFVLVNDLGKVEGLEYILINDLTVDKAGAYWIASTFGLYRMMNGQVSVVQKSGSCRLTWYDDRQLVIARDEGIWLCDTHTLSNRQVFDNQSGMAFLMSSLYLDKQTDRLWFGTVSNGLFTFDFGKGELNTVLKSSFPRKPILDIEDNAGTSILIGVDGHGVWELDRSGKTVLNVYKESADDPSSLRGNGVYDIFCDPNKRVWVATYSGGLSFFDQVAPVVRHIVHHANNQNSLVNNDVNGIVEDRFGKLWFATNNGISCWDVKTNQWRRYYYEEKGEVKVFLTLCEDDNGRIWAGSYSSGVYVLDSQTGRQLAHYTSEEEGSPLPNNFIFDFLKDSQGNIWIGGVNGLFVCYLSHENRFKSYPQEPISSFAELSNNEILLGCSYGLLLFNKQASSTSILMFGVSVRDLLVRGDDIWICTGGDGLLKYSYKNKTTERFTTQSGLTSNFVNSIAFADNYLWIGTENGLCRFSPDDKSFVTYSSIYPLSRASFNNASRFTLKNGQFAWGTNNGAVVFAPDSIRGTQSTGTIFFQDLAVAGRSVRELETFKLDVPVDSLKSLDLKYYQNTVTLELLPLQTSSGAKFSWMLEGFDKKWTHPSDNRIVTYTNIPSGEFVLKVRLYDGSMSRVIAERAMTLNVVPPFWRSLWFWGVIYFVLLGFALLVFKYIIKSLKQKHTEEKVRFFTNTAHDIRTSLTLIKAPVEELAKEPALSESGRYYLNLAIEQARRLSMVVSQLMDFQKVDIGKEQLSLSRVDVVKFVSNRILMFDSLAKSKGIDIVFDCNVESCSTAIDEGKMEKVVDNLISNAIKYSHANSQVKVELLCDELQWVFRVTDKGIGIGKEAQRQLFKEFYRGENAVNSKVVGSGIGLVLVKNYASMHNGNVSCQSHEGVGSTFQVVIPVNHAADAKNSETNYPMPQSATIPSVEAVGQSTDADSDEPHKEMKVLVVEDNDDLLRFMQNTLGRDFMVSTASDGANAWEMIRKQMPDVVVSDVMMPDMDGFELCRLIKSTYETSHIPVLLLTALSDKDDQMHGLGLGADDYVTKPFDMGLLQQRIRSIARNREMVRDKALKVIKHDSAEPILANELNDKFMKRILEVARENIANSEFNKDDFASAMNVSSSLLYKKVKSLTNLSPTDFIKIVRLDYALELLQSRKYTVTEVSELCGFTSVGYFSTVFRKHFGKSPTEVME